MNYRTWVRVCLVALLTMSGAPSTASSLPLRDYLKITDVAWESASPDGSSIAYTSEESGTWQVWLTTFAGTTRRQLTNAKDAVDFAQWIPNDRHTILYSTSHGGDGVDQFYYVRDDHPGSVPLFPSESKVTHVFGAFSPDGTDLAFSSNYRKAGVFDVYVFNRMTRSMRRVYTIEGTAYATSWSRDGKQLIVRRVVNPYDDDLYSVNLRTEFTRLLTPHSGQATFDSSQFTPDGRSVICISDLDREYRTIECCLHTERDAGTGSRPRRGPSAALSKRTADGIHR